MEATTKDFIDKYMERENIPRSPHMDNAYESIITAMIEFTKLHVKAALIAASENAEVDYDFDIYSIPKVDKDSILNAYPLENIK